MPRLQGTGSMVAKSLLEFWYGTESQFAMVLAGSGSMTLLEVKGFVW